MSKLKNACDSCKYFHPDEQMAASNIGQCRRYPPQNERLLKINKITGEQSPELRIKPTFVPIDYCCGEWS